MIYWQLFLAFLEVGCLSFGGAYSAIPLIRDVVGRYGWLAEDALSELIAVSESTPGPIMVNLATYVGSTQAGVAGAAVATLAVLLPAFVIIVLLVTLLQRVTQNAWVQAVLGGVKSAVTGIVLATGISMLLRQLVPTWTSMDGRDFVMAGVLALIFFGSKPLLGRRVSPILLILLAAALGVLAYGW